MKIYDIAEKPGEEGMTWIVTEADTTDPEKTVPCVEAPEYASETEARAEADRLNKRWP